MSQSNVPAAPSISLGQVTKELQNQVFRGDSTLSKYNACVGDNGYPNIYYYADGFAKAVFSLIDDVIKNELSSIDTYIYPICFNLRHSVELYLKALWEQLSKLAKTKDVHLQRPLANGKEVNILKLHDIGIIWNGVKSNATSLDRRFSPILDSLEPLITCIHQVDPTGQTFRYSYDMETNVKHLVPVALINIINLKVQFSTIKNDLEKLKSLSLYLNYEYSMGTFTNNLSRADIGEISLRLPVREKWKDGELSRVRPEIMAEYGIGCREFSSAVKYIETCHDFSSQIGMEKTPLGLSEKELLRFSDIWGIRNDINEWRNLLLARLDEANVHTMGVESHFNDGDAMFDRMMIDIDRNKKAFGEFSKFASPHIISGIVALCEYRGCSFSEEYEFIYSNELETLNSCYEEGGDRWMAAMKNAWREYFESSYCLQKIIVSLWMLKMKSSALALERHCMVEGLIPQTN